MKEKANDSWLSWWSFEARGRSGTSNLTDRDLRIGRAPENDVILEDPDRTVSRFHAELRFENGQYALIDLNSQNGLWMDGQRLPRLTLEPGRPVSVGMFRLLLEADDQRAAAAAAASSRPHDARERHAGWCPDGGTSADAGAWSGRASSATSCAGTGGQSRASASHAETFGRETSRSGVG